MLHKEELDRLSVINGLPTNDYERFVITTLKIEIEGLNQDIETRRQNLQWLEEQEEAFNAELRTLTELDDTYLEALKENIDSIWSKNNVLKTYMGVVTNEFTISKLKADNDTYGKNFYQKLQPFMDKSKQVKEKLKILRETKDVCSDLKQQNDALMAPPH